MKQYLRTLLSGALALSMACGLALPAAASDALGDDLTSQDTLLNESTQLSTNVFWSSAYSDLRTENLITYSPNSAVTPMVTYGGALTDCSTVSATAAALESQGYRVVAGINGDFYNVNNGLPIGAVVAAGEVKSSDGGYYAIGFRGDGSAILGRPTIRVAADFGYMMPDANGNLSTVTRQLTAVNKARVSSGGIYLYTYDFNARHTTGTTEAGVDVVCTIQSGSLQMNGEPLVVTVDQVLTNATGTAIPQGKVVLSANNQADSYQLSALKNLPVGSTVTLSVSANDGWADVEYGVGALYSLVEYGSIVSGLPTGVNPRTAVGQRSDGTLLFYTIDGRRSGHSVGASLAQVAQRLIELGCVTAVCLDGGGSTTLAVTQPDATTSETVNRPSGGSERAVSNQIFLVASGQPTGELHHFYVAADNPYVLAGSAVTLSASAVDTHYIPMGRGSYTLSASAGTISGDVLTTPAGGGDVTVTASGGGRSGTTVVHAISTPDSISVSTGASPITTLTAAPGSTVALSASAVYRHLPLKADAAAFTWTLSNSSIGTVDGAGRFTAGQPGSGSLTVSAGGKSVTIQVNVSEIPLSTVEDFEGGVPALAEYSYGAVLAQNANTNYVRYGLRSAKLDYTLDAAGIATVALTTPYSIGTAYTLLNLWVYGDNSGNTLTLQVSDGSTTTELDGGVLDFTGWKQITLPLPAGAASLTGLTITGVTGMVTLEDGSEQWRTATPTGTVYLDQITASYNGIVDTAAPQVTATLTGTALTASILDAGGDKYVAQSGVSVTLDGKAIPFTYDGATGALTATISIADTAAHRVTVTAKDASGNIGRASCDVAASGGGAQFTDTAGYWAGSFVDWLKTAGITTGYEDGTFRPNQSISRQQFAVMLYRYLGLDGTEYESVTLPFADNGEIGDYALTAIKTLYTRGIINGSEENGKLYFHPGSSLTRAQAATMIGRTQQRGYAAADLSFTDAATIPAYAAFYIQTMVAQGVVSGYEDGAFRPSQSITRGQMAKILYNLI